MAQEKSIVVASTTSTQDSGLFDYLLPLFTQKTGIAVKVLAQGTGQALDTGRRGEADVVFVHNKSSENRFIDEGDGVRRIGVGRLGAEQWLPVLGLFGGNSLRHNT